MFKRRPPNAPEFESARGERVRQGDPRIHGVMPQPGNIPIGPAPPHIRQVVSTYDARPIGGYDFVLSAVFSTYTETPQAVVQSPKGYVTVVRRIEVAFNPMALLSDAVLWTFAANGVVATSWNWNTGKVLEDKAIDVFFVVPPNTPFSLKGGGGLINFDSTQVTVRFIGNLVLDSNDPANEQVGSLPHTVKLATPGQSHA